MHAPQVLDACCGGRMFWFNRSDPRAVFVDIRQESFSVNRANGEMFHVAPDVISSFSDLPFPDKWFSMVVFDPPHIQRTKALGFLTRKYGFLSGEWREMIHDGFIECFRVLRPNGTLVFKWSETEVAVSEVLELTDQKPLFGSRCGKRANTHWIVFLKQDAPDKIEEHHE
jgi:ubiquinone/menaquinone biosynthesis C-methylase UbiE